MKRFIGFLIPRHPLYFKWLLVCLLGCVQIDAFALKSDQQQATKFTADKVDFNDVTQEYVLTGKVVVQKGSILVKGIKAVIVVDPDGFQKISVISDGRSLSEFTQQLDGPTPEYIYAEGELIMFEEKDDHLFILGQAFTKRSSGNTWRDKLVADEIQYNLFTEKYTAISKQNNQLAKSTLAPKFKESPQLTNYPLNNATK